MVFVFCVKTLSSLENKMMSRYSDGITYDNSPPTTPRGRRYILRNFNARKQRKTTFPERNDYNDYFDIAKAPSSQGSQTPRVSNHVGTSNRVVPTENAKNTSPRKISPRKQPREPPVFVSPKKDPETYAKSQTPHKDINGNITSTSYKKGVSNESSPSKGVANEQSPRKGVANEQSPRKGVANEPSPRKGVANEPSPRKGVANEPSPRKGVANDSSVKTTSPRKDNKDKQNKEDKDNMAVSKRSEKGLTPRDEYMVTKLYGSKIIYLKPSEVRYTHDQTTAHFSDGRSMLSTFIAFLYGRVEIRLGGNDIPPIEVMQVEETDGKLWYVVNGNRRLYVFRRLERCGALDSMQVVARKYDTVEMDKHFLTRNHGRKISVINDSQIDAKMKKEVQKWREKGGKKRPAQKSGRKKQPGNNPPAKSSCCTIL